MIIINIMSYILLLILPILMMLVMIIMKKSNNDREKSSPFECGFDPKTSSRLPFSLQFFLIALIFLIFDVEISLLSPIIFLYNAMNLSSLLMLALFFIIILIMGLLHEWNQGALSWMN